MQFVLVISGTETIKHPGISAAGASHQELQYTAALDAEFISNGFTSIKKNLPFSPAGIISPAIFTRAFLCREKLSAIIINAGSHHKPDCKQIELKSFPSADISSGQAMPIEEVYELYYKSQNYFQDNIEQFKDGLVLAECLVSGTTTAQAVLTLLGYQVNGLISSSIPEGNHDLKNDLIKNAISAIDNPDFQEDIKEDPLYAISYLGDAMQVVFLGMIMAASKNKIPISLAGGTQMLAIKAVADRLDPNSNKFISIYPSPWILNDKSSNFMKLKEMVSPKINVISTNLETIKNSTELEKDINKICTDLNLNLDFNRIISAYGAGHVKEGVGMAYALSRHCEPVGRGNPIQ